MLNQNHWKKKFVLKKIGDWKIKKLKLEILKGNVKIKVATIIEKIKITKVELIRGMQVGI